eukprot:1183897-Prorocentrum_minimum.AAC.2
MESDYLPIALRISSGREALGIQVWYASIKDHDRGAKTTSNARMKHVKIKRCPFTQLRLNPHSHLPADDSPCPLISVILLNLTATSIPNWMGTSPMLIAIYTPQSSYKIRPKRSRLLPLCPALFYLTRPRRPLVTPFQWPLIKSPGYYVTSVAAWMFKGFRSPLLQPLGLGGTMLITKGTKAVFTNCSFVNSRVRYDGASYDPAVGPRITGGGAVAVVDKSEAEFTNCLFVGNHAVKAQLATTASALQVLLVSGPRLFPLHRGHVPRALDWPLFVALKSSYPYQL